MSTDSTAAVAPVTEVSLEDVDAFRIGECLAGDGNEIAHIEVIYGSRRGPVGQAWLNGFTAGHSKGYTPLPIAKPNNILPLAAIGINKFMMGGLKGIMQNFGPVQDVAYDALLEGAGKEWFKPHRKLAEAGQTCIVVGIFIHGAAHDTKKLRDFNKEAIATAFERCITGTPTLTKAEEDYKAGLVKHPFADWQADAPATPAGPTELELKQAKLLDLQIVAAERAARPWFWNLFS